MTANQLAALTAQKDEFIRLTQEQQQQQEGKITELTTKHADAVSALSARDKGTPTSTT